MHKIYFFVLFSLFSISFIWSKTPFYRDPFMPLYTKGASGTANADKPVKIIPKKELNKNEMLLRKPPIHLTGIIWDPVKPMAVVVSEKTKRIVGLNDSFMGYIVKKITRKNIVIYDGTTSISVEVGEQKKFD